MMEEAEFDAAASEPRSDIPLDNAEAGVSLPAPEEVGGGSSRRQMEPPSEASESVSEIPLDRAETGASLPTPEELQGRSSNNRRRRPFCSLWFAAAFFFVVVLAVVGVGVGVSRNNSSSSEEPPSTERKFSVEQLAVYLDQNGVTDTADILNDFGSPQSKAAFWLAETDARNVNLPSVSVDEPEGYGFLTRYVLATVYYATAGDNWLFDFKFLSQDDVCDWRGARLSNDGQVIPFGSLCRQSTEQIYALYLGTSPKREKLFVLARNLQLLCALLSLTSQCFYYSCGRRRPKSFERNPPFGADDSDNLGGDRHEF
jgi:hypothetical protein